jgi:hypothetical protein
VIVIEPEYEPVVVVELKGMLPPTPKLRLA